MDFPLTIQLLGLPPATETAKKPIDVQVELYTIDAHAVASSVGDELVTVGLFIWRSDEHYNVRPPSHVSWFISPSNYSITIVINTINHSDIGLINQLSYLGGLTL